MTADSRGVPAREGVARAGGVGISETVLFLVTVSVARMPVPPA
jgi:hypothetical protein